MKIRLKNKNLNLHNCWKQCGVSKEDWNKLQTGEEIDAKTIFIDIEHLVEKTSSSTTKKGNK